MEATPQTHDAQDYRLRRKAASVPMLDAEREAELLRSVQQGDTAALQQLLASHQRLAVAVADKYARRGIPFEDLVSEGTLGLVEAARRFEPERGTRFATYAGWWVRAYVRRYAMGNRRQVQAPSTRNARRIQWGLRRTQRELAQRLGREASRAEVAEALDVDPEEVASVEAALGGRDVSLGPAEDGTVFEVAGNDATPEEHTADVQLRESAVQRVRDALGRLTPREREIIQRRLLDDEASSLSELGRSLGVSRERVRQLQQRAQHKLRSRLLERAA